MLLDLKEEEKDARNRSSPVYKEGVLKHHRGPWLVLMYVVRGYECFVNKVMAVVSYQ